MITLQRICAGIKHRIIIAVLLSLLLLTGITGGMVAVEITPAVAVVITCTTQSNPVSLQTPERILPGSISYDRIYASVSPYYTENLLRSYGPVPVITKDHRVLWRGVLSGKTSQAERDAWDRKMKALYDASADSFDEMYGFPRGPVISYGHDVLGSVVVGIYEEEGVDSPTLDGMYSFIAAEAQKQGIADVPVIFCSEPMAEFYDNGKEIRSPVFRGTRLHLPAGVHLPHISCLPVFLQK